MNVSSQLSIGFAMVTAMVLTNLAARRFRIPQSILLVLVGAGLAFVPGVPRVTLNPELVLLLLLPPLLYSSGVGMSWRGFKSNLRSIMLLATGCVLFTAVAVAASTHWLLGLPWAVGFVLGAVVSPPDAVAPMAIARRLAVPRRVLTVLEGEGLVNDATALILFSFAVAAAVTGGISIERATRAFAVIVGGEILWGISVGWLLLRLRAWSKSPEIEIVLALLTPFAAFWPPHALGGSGVLATVVTGLFVSWNGPRFIAPATRLQGFFVWGLVVYVIEGMVFLLTGLQARAVIEGPDSDEWVRMMWAALLTIAVVVLVRFIWVFSATYLPRLVWRRLGERDPAPSWQQVFLVSFTGIRGVVSLVAALSVPELIGEHPFPGRDLILFVTFVVILASLVGQGAALPKLIRGLGLDTVGEQESADAKRREIDARVAGIDAALARLAELERAGASGKAVETLRRYHTNRRSDFVQTGDVAFDGAPAADTAALQAELVEAERASIALQYRQGMLSDEARRRIEREFDLEDARLRHASESATGEQFIEPT